MDNQKRSRELLKGTGIYAIGTFGTKILSFLVVPLYTYYIATADMGIYDLLMSTISLLAPIITMQISDAAYRWIIRDEGDADRYIRTTVQVLVTNCLLAALIVLMVNTFITIPYCGYFAILLILTRMTETLQKLLRALKNQKLFAVSGIIYSVVFLSLNFVQICLLKKGIIALFQSAVIASFVAIFSIILLEKRLRINYFKKPEFGLIKQFYAFSAPLVPNYLNWWVINSSDRYIVMFFLGLSANGVLAIAHKFPTLLNTVLHLFTISWQDISVAEKETDVGQYYTKVFRQYYRIVFSFLLILIPVTKIIVFLVMGPNYKEACDYIAFYYLGTVFQSFASFYGVGYLRNKNTKKAFTTSIYAALINAAINIMLIRIIGLQAAAVSTFVGFSVMWLIREKQNRDELKIRIQWPEFTLLTAASVAMSIGSICVGLKLNAVLMLVGLAVFIVMNYKSGIHLLHMLTARLRHHS